MLIDERLYLASLVDLPCLVEAQKTLDFRTFFKSTDVSQMLYIHNRFMDDFPKKSADDVFAFAESFNPYEDHEFFAGLYRRGEIAKRVEEIKKASLSAGTKPNWSGMADMMKYRHGLAPPTKNVRNIRFKKE